MKEQRDANILTEENDDRVNMGPHCLRLFGVQREADAVGPVEVPKQSFTRQRKEGNDKPKHPYSKKDGDSSSPARGQVLEGVHNADVLLQREVREEQDGHLGGQHGQGADDLTLTAVHPGLSVSVVLAAVLQVIRADHEEVDAHQAVRTCPEGKLLVKFIFLMDLLCFYSIFYLLFLMCSTVLPFFLCSMFLSTRLSP